jgi:hypothetical protein
MKDMHIIAVKTSFVGYITKDGEYLGKTLPPAIMVKLKERTWNSIIHAKLNYSL